MLPLFLSIRPHIIGVRVKDVSRLTVVAKTTVRPSSLKKRPMISPMKAMGRKTTRFVAVELKMAMAISRAPTMAACCGSMPSCMKRLMFSRIRMALLTSTPMTMASPVRLMMLRLRPQAAMPMKATMIDAGITTLTMTVDFQDFMNRKSVAPVSRTPMNMFVRTLLSAPRMKLEESSATSTWAPGGSMLCRRGRTLRMPSATSTSLASLRGWMARMTVALPSKRLVVRFSSWVSTTVPRSPTVTMPRPSVGTRTPATSSTFRKRPTERMTNSRPGCVMWPAGTSRLAARMAPATALSGTLCSRSLPASSSTCTSRFWPPVIWTSPTPVTWLRTGSRSSSARR